MCNEKKCQSREPQTQLLFSQKHVDESAKLAQRAFQAWLDDITSARQRRMAIEAIDQLYKRVEQHFTRVADEGLVKHIAEPEPAHNAQLRELECWQTGLMDQLRKLAAHVRHCDCNPAAARRIADCLEHFQQGLQQEEESERTLADRFG